MNGAFLRIRTWWETADRTQRVVTVFGGAFLVVLLGLTFFFASKPKMAILFGGLSPQDMGMVAAELQKAGIPHDYDTSGNVTVPSDQIPRARAALANAGKLPASGHSGYADFEKMSMITTPSVEKERIKAAIEGELAKSVEQIAGVASARVHITMGDDSPFVRDRKEPTASVFVSQSSGLGVMNEQARAIARLVANAVPRLAMKNIAVITSEGQTLWDGQSEAGADGRAEQKVQAENQEAKRREQEIQQKLDAVLGAGNSVVSVDLTMDFDQTSQTETVVTPSEGPITFESSTESMASGAAGGAGGVASDANLGVVTAAPAGAGGGESQAGYTSKQEAKQFDRNVTQRSTEKAVGTIKSMSINVLVNSAKVEDTAPVTAFLEGYLGPKLDDPSFAQTVTSLEFDTTQQKKSAEASAAAASNAKMQQYVSLLPVLALLVVGFLVVKAIGKAMKPNVMVAAMPDGTMMPMTVSGANPGVGALPPTQELGEENALVASNGPMTDPLTGDPIESIAQRVDVPLEQIKKLSKERPDVVAMLLKSWLLEERR